MMTASAAPPIIARGDLAANASSFLRHIRAENLSPATIVTYMQSIARLAGVPSGIGMKGDRALDRYLRARAKHPHAQLPWLWLGPKGRLTATGTAQMIKRRGAEAGLPGLHPHALRHDRT
jgi:hypothetical protein